MARWVSSGILMDDPAERCGPVNTCSEAHRAIIDAVHTIHKGALPNDITPNLTADYYAKIIRLMTESENGVLGIAYADGVPIAFCFTAFDPNQFSAKIARERWLLLKSISRFAISRPALLIDLAGAALGKSRIVVGETTACPEIYAICVGDGHRSQGIGVKLLNHAVDHVRRCGHSAITVKTSDPRALAFYERQGFKRIGEQNRFGRRLAILKREI